MSGRRGVALAGVLFGLVILGAIAAALGFSALQEVRAGRSRLGAAAAELALADAAAAAMAGWNPAVMQRLAPGDSVVLGPVTVRRTAAALFAIEAQVADSLYQAERRGAFWLRVDPPQLPVAALVLTGGLPLSDAADVDSVNQAPPGWSCQPSHATIVAASVQHQITSWPDLPWDSLRLTRWAQRNWVVDSFELVHEGGDLIVTGGRRMGVFVVDGELVLRGLAQLIGVIIARGGIVSEGLGGAIIGVAVTPTVSRRALAAPGSVRLAFSACGAGLPILALAPVRPLERRAHGPLR